MPSSFFVDAWFLIALIDPSDTHHRAARRLSEALRRASFVTHDGVFIEVLAYFSGQRGARLSAASLVRESAYTFGEVVAADRALFIAGLALYEQRPDKKYSLVDCMSMHLMKQLGITHVLTNDHHFRQEGFTVVNE